MALLIRFAIIFFHGNVFLLAMSVNEVLNGARCQSQCIKEFGLNRCEHETVCEEKRSQCSLACESLTQSLEKCNELCNISKDPLSCRKGCGILDKIRRTPAIEETDKRLPIDSVTLLCMNVATHISHDQSIGSLPSVMAKFVINVIDNYDFRIDNLVYIIFLRRKLYSEWSGFTSLDDWIPLGYRTDRTFIVEKLSPNVEYQVRVAAVAEDRIYRQFTTNTSFWFKTLAADSHLIGPLMVQAGDQILSDSSLKVKIEWIPDPAYKSCFYHLAWQSINDTQYRTIFLDNAPFYEIHQLAFDTQYTIILRSVSGFENPRDESEPILTRFFTKSCIEATFHDFALCSPGSVTNLSLDVQTDKNKAIIRWLPPKYVVYPEKHLLNYEVRWRSFSIKAGNCSSIAYENVTLDSHSNNLTIKVTAGCSYLMEVWATSTGGKGPASKVQFVHMPNKNSISQEGVNFLPYITAMSLFIFVLVCILSISVIIVYKKQASVKQLKAQRSRSASFISGLVAKRHHYLLGQFTNYKSNDSLPSTDQDLSNCLTLIQKLNDGEFGCVWKATCNYPGIPQIVAVKKIKDVDYKFDSRRHLENEIFIYQRLSKHKHCNLVQYFGDVSIPKLQLVIEFCFLGNLKDYLPSIEDSLKVSYRLESGRRVDTGRLVGCHELLICKNHGTQIDNHSHLRIDSPVLLKLARQIATGMQHLAKFRFVHRDLAARNVLVTGHSSHPDDVTLKISDFGLSLSCDHKSDASAVKVPSAEHLPLRWTALEALSSKGLRATQHSDVWSFGVVLWEMVTFGQRLPYDKVDEQFFENVNAICGLLRGGYRMDQPKNCSNDLYDMMLECWDEQPCLRRPFSGIVQWLNKLLEKNEYVLLENSVTDL